MSVKSIIMIGNTILREKAATVDFLTDPIGSYIGDLRDTLHHVQREKKIGRAIAGPQLGYLKRIVYLEAGGDKIIMINPQITQASKKTFEVWDSCFSADLAFFGKTLRHRTISVNYFDENGREREDVFSDDMSELCQHEIDHLDGILFTDRIIANQIMMRSEWEKLAG